MCGLGVVGKELEGLHFSLWFVCLFVFGLLSGLGSEVAVLGEIDVSVSPQQRADIQCTSTLPATGYSNRVLQEKQSSTPVIAAIEQRRRGILEAQ